MKGPWRRGPSPVRSLSSARSIATMRRAPAAHRAEHRGEPDAAQPDRPPRSAPVASCAVLTTAPTPVSTAQPNSAASVERQLRVDLHQRAARHRRVFGEGRAPRWWYERLAVRGAVARWPLSSVPAVLATAPGSHSAGRPSAHGAQWPQLGTKTITTWSPRSRSSTPAPVASTMPAASWPSTIGVGRGRSPLITERSEWHRPGGGDLHQHLARARRVELDRLDRERFRLRIGCGRPHRVQHGSVDLHRVPPLSVEQTQCQIAYLVECEAVKQRRAAA